MALPLWTNSFGITVSDSTGQQLMLKHFPKKRKSPPHPRRPIVINSSDESETEFFPRGSLTHSNQGGPDQAGPSRPNFPETTPTLGLTRKGEIKYKKRSQRLGPVWTTPPSSSSGQLPPRDDPRVLANDLSRFGRPTTARPLRNLILETDSSDESLRPPSSASSTWSYFPSSGKSSHSSDEGTWEDWE